MWRRKKFIVAALVAAAVLAGSIAGVALAQTESGDDSQPKTLLERVAEILVGEGVSVTSEQLEEAFTQAQSDMRDEAVDSYLQNLIEQGKITEEQAQQYKAWLQAKPDMGQFQQQLREWQQAKPSLPPELKEWQQAKPDIPLPAPFGRFGGHGFSSGMKWGGGRHFWGK